MGPFILNRRDFLRAAASTAAGASLGGQMSSLAAQSPRIEVHIAGRRVKTVDIHAHCVFDEVSALVEGTALARQFPDWYLLGPHRIEMMNERGIDVAALSVNTYWWYAADLGLAERIVRAHDEGLAGWCAAHPDRFVALSSPALQDPGRAAEQLTYAVETLGARGASVGGTVLGESISMPKYDAFWGRAEELGVPVFMHPTDSVYLLREGGLPRRGNQGNVIGNPLETTVFLTNMIFDGTLDRFPALKVCAAHGGGYLPSYLGRTEVACGRANADCLNRKSPSEYLRTQILVDSMVFSAEGLRHLVAEAGPNQVVYGSDMPFAWPETMDLIIDAPFLSAAEKEAILGGNLIELLRIDPEV